jgi:type IV pilus biogenesis protein CpaD/CtpE
VTRTILAAAVLALLAGCASDPPAPVVAQQMTGFAAPYQPGQVGVGGFVAPTGPSSGRPFQRAGN